MGSRKLRYKILADSYYSIVELFSLYIYIYTYATSSSFIIVRRKIFIVERVVRGICSLYRGEGEDIYIYIYIIRSRDGNCEAIDPASFARFSGSLNKATVETVATQLSFTSTQWYSCFIARRQAREASAA